MPVRKRSLAAFGLTSCASLLLAGAADAGSVSVLYNFPGGSTAVGEPTGPLTPLGGVYYGIAANHNGAVFKITSSGSETVLYQFGGASPPAAGGSHPSSPLVALNNVLYGTTGFGGQNGGGTVYAITPAGAERVIYTPPNATGTTPVGFDGVIAVGSTLYGVTDAGGADNAGTVYSLTLDGTLTVLHSFAQATDGGQPEGRLLYANGELYGTATVGGSGTACSGGCGTVFSVDLSGKFQVLHNFDLSDGALPSAQLTMVGGTLYGTTPRGGLAGSCSSAFPFGGCGTAFAIAANGAFTSLYDFTGGSDGGDPTTGLVYNAGTFYGSTAVGGSGADGTIFTLTAGGTLSTVLSLTRKIGYDVNGDVLLTQGMMLCTGASGGSSNAGTIFALTP